MTHDYKDALDEFTEFAKEQEDGSVYICVTGENYETIYSALKLAQEAEQLRKERDEFKELYDVMVERYTELAKKVVGE